MPHMTEPARRHLCELCNAIFECHLCTIHWTHDVHAVSSGSQIQVYVCEDCATANGLLYLNSPLGTMDYLTGDWVNKYKKRIFNVYLSWSAKP